MKKIIFIFLILSYASISKAEYDVCANDPKKLLESFPTTERAIGLKAAMLTKSQRESEAIHLYKKLVVISERLKTQRQAEIWSEKQLYLALRKCYLNY